MHTSLTIGEKKPIIHTVEYPGEKTLFVHTQRNWGTGTVIKPNPALDIEITVRFGFSGIFSEDKFRLPAVGVYKTYNGDMLEAFAEYITDQGLVTPFPQYDITGHIFRGIMTPTVINHVGHVTTSDVPLVIPSANLPSWITEFRYTGESLALIDFLNHTNTGNDWYRRYTSIQLHHWNPLPVMAARYTLYIWGYKNSHDIQTYNFEFR